MHRLVRALGAALAVCLGVAASGPSTPPGPPQRYEAAAPASGPGGVRSGATTVGTADVGAGWVGRENAKRGSPGWRIRPGTLASDTQLAGYADRASIRPGEPLHLFVTTTAPSYTVRAYRLGWYGGALARLVSTSPVLRGTVQPAHRLDSRRMVTTSWRRSATVDTAGWPEGTYLLRLTDSRGLGKYIPVTVRSSTVRGRLVLLNAVITYQAYNTWGGYSLYGGPDNSFATRANAVSFDRPYDQNGARIVTNYEQALIAEAERANLPLAYLTDLDLDLERGVHVLDGARGLVSLGHDEYWTTAMRQRVTAARDHGTNLAFMGANPVYWRVRLHVARWGRPGGRGLQVGRARPGQAVAEHDGEVARQPGADAREQPRGHAVRVLPRTRRARRPRPGLLPVPRHRRPQRDDVRRAGRPRDRPRLPRGRHPAGTSRSWRTRRSPAGPPCAPTPT